MSRLWIPVIFCIAFAASATAQTSHTGNLITPVRNQEICLGEAVAVRASVQNADNVARTVQLSVGFRNAVTGNLSYWRAVTVPNLQPKETREIDFPEYSTSPNVLSELGTFNAVVAVNALDSEGNVIAHWPYIDTSSYHIFGLRTTSLPFIENCSNYGSYNLPDQTRWTSIGATVVEGDTLTWDAPPPNDTADGYGLNGYHSPVLRLDRYSDAGAPYVGTTVGDTLSSFPLNAGNWTRLIMSFDFQRGGRIDYGRSMLYQTMPGPEPTVFGTDGKKIASGDSLLLEFADANSTVCNPEQWHTILALDGGADLEYKSLTLYVDTESVLVHRSGSSETYRIELGRNYFSGHFRFRFRLAAHDNSTVDVSDDADAWYLDNITLTAPRYPELATEWVRVVSPYTKLPRTCLNALPVFLRAKNYGVGNTIDPPTWHVLIESPDGEFVYNSLMDVRIPELTDTVLLFPSWDATGLAPGRYKVYGSMDVDGYDTYSEDDRCFSYFYLNYDPAPGLTQEFAYDDAGISPAQGAGNDIQHGRSSSGIGFNGVTGSFAMRFELPKRDTIYGTRVYFANDNQSPDLLRISLRTNNAATGLPGDTVAGLRASTFEDVRRGGYFNQFWPYYFPVPLVIEPGTYWITVSQLSTDNFTMGGDNSRGAALLHVQDSGHPIMSAVFSDPYGTQETASVNTGDISTAFAYESPAGSNAWKPWTPSAGTWATSGARPVIAPYDPLPEAALASTTYLPMIRVLVGRSLFDNVEPKTTRLDEYLAPNPFNPLAGSLRLPGEGGATVYNQVGSVVRRLPKSSAGWDGRNESGGLVPDGVYYIEFGGIPRPGVRVVVNGRNR